MENQERNQRNEELFAELAKYPKDSKEYRDIESKIVKNNERLVKHVAYKHFPTLMKPTVNSDDLISAGYLGLLNAIRLYKPEKGIFSGYAAWRIQCYMLKHLKRERRHNSRSDSLEDDKNGTERKLKDVLASPVNIEEDFVDRDETDRQLAWVRKNLDQLTPTQKKVINLKYLSGEASLIGNALANEFECTRQNISQADIGAIEKLRKLYYESHPEEIEMKQKELELTREEKIEMKELLGNLISTELAPKQKEAMLCKFYSVTQKTNKQVAQEFNLKEANVSNCVIAGTKRLCTIYNGIKDKKHLTSKAIKDILNFQIEESGKER